MDLWKLLIVILILVIVYLLLGGSIKVSGGAEKKKAKKPAKKPAKKESEEQESSEKPEKREKPERKPGDPFEITESEQCMKYLNEGGKKKVIARLNGDYFKEMKPGDTIIVKSKEGTPVEKKLVSKHKYGSFKEMFEKEGLENVFPGSSGIDAAIDHYRQFYSEEKEKERGVIALLFE